MADLPTPERRCYWWLNSDQADALVHAHFGRTDYHIKTHEFSSFYDELCVFDTINDRQASVHQQEIAAFEHGGAEALRWYVLFSELVRRGVLPVGDYRIDDAHP